MRTVLITAYAADPYKGSEDGTGWNTAVALALRNKVILVTRRNNIPHIQRYLEQHPDPVHENMRCIGHDLSERSMRWKKRLGERGYVAYFYLWQYTLPSAMKRLGIQFDIAHALNFHSDSTPHFLWKMGKPVVWGPVGHHPPVPRRFILRYGVAPYIRDRAYNAVKWCLRNLDPNFRKAVCTSRAILAINSSVQVAMGAPAHKLRILPAVAAVATLQPPVRDDRFTIVSIGRFVYMKGFDLALRSFSAFYAQLDDQARKGVKLILVGKGEEHGRLARLAIELGIEDAVEFKDWVDHSTMRSIYQRSRLLLFPSHEGAGMVVPEAMSYGLPVVCLDNAGPGELVGDAGIKVSGTHPQQVVHELSQALAKLHADPELLELLGRKACERQRNLLTWAHKADAINAIYDHLHLVP
jgi:glycosyltransferase involved in cell wall biosynthesis